MLTVVLLEDVQGRTTMHRAMMRNSSKIVAINTGSQAPVFKVAHHPMVGELCEELPELVGAVGEGEHAN